MVATAGQAQHEMTREWPSARLTAAAGTRREHPMATRGVIDAQFVDTAKLFGDQIDVFSVGSEPEGDMEFDEINRYRVHVRPGLKKTRMRVPR